MSRQKSTHTSVFEIAVQFDNIRNIDLLRQGLYFVSCRAYTVNNEGVQQYSKIALETLTQLEPNSKNNPQKKDEKKTQNQKKFTESTFQPRASSDIFSGNILQKKNLSDPYSSTTKTQLTPSQVNSFSCPSIVDRTCIPYSIIGQSEEDLKKIISGNIRSIKPPRGLQTNIHTLPSSINNIRNMLVTDTMLDGAYSLCSAPHCLISGVCTCNESKNLTTMTDLEDNTNTKDNNTNNKLNDGVSLNETHSITQNNSKQTLQSSTPSTVSAQKPSPSSRLAALGSDLRNLTPQQRHALSLKAKQPTNDTTPPITQTQNTKTSPQTPASPASPPVSTTYPCTRNCYPKCRCLLDDYVEISLFDDVDDEEGLTDLSSRMLPNPTSSKLAKIHGVKQAPKLFGSSSIDHGELIFKSQIVRMQFMEQTILLNDSCLFRLELPPPYIYSTQFDQRFPRGENGILLYPDDVFKQDLLNKMSQNFISPGILQPTPLYFDISLHFYDYNTKDSKHNVIPDESEFHLVSTRTLCIPDIFLRSTSAIYPVRFDSNYLLSVNCIIHTTLTEHRFRNRFVDSTEANSHFDFFHASSSSEDDDNDNDDSDSDYGNELDGGTISNGGNSGHNLDQKNATIIPTLNNDIINIADKNALNTYQDRIRNSTTKFYSALAKNERQKNLILASKKWEDEKNKTNFEENFFSSEINTNFPQLIFPQNNLNLLNLSNNRSNDANSSPSSSFIHITPNSDEFQPRNHSGSESSFHLVSNDNKNSTNENKNKKNKPQNHFDENNIEQNSQKKVLSAVSNPPTPLMTPTTLEHFFQPSPRNSSTNSTQHHSNHSDHSDHSNHSQSRGDTGSFDQINAKQPQQHQLQHPHHQQQVPDLVRAEKKQHLFLQNSSRDNTRLINGSTIISEDIDRTIIGAKLLQDGDDNEPENEPKNEPKNEPENKPENTTNLSTSPLQLPHRLSPHQSTRSAQSLSTHRTSHQTGPLSTLQIKPLTTDSSLSFGGALSVSGYKFPNLTSLTIPPDSPSTHISAKTPSSPSQITSNRLESLHTSRISRNTDDGGKNVAARDASITPSTRSTKSTISVKGVNPPQSLNMSHFDTGIVQLTPKNKGANGGDSFGGKSAENVENNTQNNNKNVTTPSSLKRSTPHNQAQTDLGLQQRLNVTQSGNNTTTTTVTSLDKNAQNGFRQDILTFFHDKNSFEVVCNCGTKFESSMPELTPLAIFLFPRARPYHQYQHIPLGDSYCLSCDAKLPLHLLPYKKSPYTLEQISVICDVTHRQLLFPLFQHFFSLSACLQNCARLMPETLRDELKLTLRRREMMIPSGLIATKYSTQHRPSIVVDDKNDDKNNDKNNDKNDSKKTNFEFDSSYDLLPPPDIIMPRVDSMGISSMSSVGSRSSPLRPQSRPSSTNSKKNANPSSNFTQTSKNSQHLPHFDNFPTSHEDSFQTGIAFDKIESLGAPTVNIDALRLTDTALMLKSRNYGRTSPRKSPFNSSDDGNNHDLVRSSTYGSEFGGKSDKSDKSDRNDKNGEQNNNLAISSHYKPHAQTLDLLNIPNDLNNDKKGDFFQQNSSQKSDSKNDPPKNGFKNEFSSSLQDYLTLPLRAHTATDTIHEESESSLTFHQSGLKIGQKKNFNNLNNLNNFNNFNQTVKKFQNDNKIDLFAAEIPSISGPQTIFPTPPTHSKFPTSSSFSTSIHAKNDVLHHNDSTSPQNCHQSSSRGSNMGFSERNDQLSAVLAPVVTITPSINTRRLQIHSTSDQYDLLSLDSNSGSTTLTNFVGKDDKSDPNLHNLSQKQSKSPSPSPSSHRNKSGSIHHSFNKPELVPIGYSIPPLASLSSRIRTHEMSPGKVAQYILTDLQALSQECFSLWITYYSILPYISRRLRRLLLNTWKSEQFESLQNYTFLRKFPFESLAFLGLDESTKLNTKIIQEFSTMPPLPDIYSSLRLESPGQTFCFYQTRYSNKNNSIGNMGNITSSVGNNGNSTRHGNGGQNVNFGSNPNNRTSSASVSSNNQGQSNVYLQYQQPTLLFEEAYHVDVEEYGINLSGQGKNEQNNSNIVDKKLHKFDQNDKKSGNNSLLDMTIKALQPYMHTPAATGKERYWPRYSPQNPADKHVHLIVLCHGYQGTHWDMRNLRNVVAFYNPNAYFLESEANEGLTESSFDLMGHRLAKEIDSHIINNISGRTVHRISFIAHSMGGIIVRACLVSKTFAPWVNKCYTYVSLATPHCGFKFGQGSNLISTGLWLLQKFKRSSSLQQLSLQDEQKKDFVKAFLYRLSQQISVEFYNTIAAKSTSALGISTSNSTVGAILEKPKKGIIGKDGDDDYDTDGASSRGKKTNVMKNSFSLAEKRACIMVDSLDYLLHDVYSIQKYTTYATTALSHSINTQIKNNQIFEQNNHKNEQNPSKHAFLFNTHNFITSKNLTANGAQTSTSIHTTPLPNSTPSPPPPPLASSGSSKNLGGLNNEEWNHNSWFNSTTLNIGLGIFRYVFVFASRQDSYSPFMSARIQQQSSLDCDIKSLFNYQVNGMNYLFQNCSRNNFPDDKSGKNGKSDKNIENGEKNDEKNTFSGKKIQPSLIPLPPQYKLTYPTPSSEIVHNILHHLTTKINPNVIKLLRPFCSQNQNNFIFPPLNALKHLLTPTSTSPLATPHSLSQQHLLTPCPHHITTQHGAGFQGNQNDNNNNNNTTDLFSPSQCICPCFLNQFCTCPNYTCCLPQIFRRIEISFPEFLLSGDELYYSKNFGQKNEHFDPNLDKKNGVKVFDGNNNDEVSFSQGGASGGSRLLRNFDALVGRAAHISFLDHQHYFEMFMALHWKAFL